MKKYTVLRDGSYRNNETNTSRITPGNWMFKEVLDWLAEGNTPDFEEAEIIMKQIRNERNERLKRTDYMLLPDYFVNHLTEDQRVDLINYRQSLRDLPKNCDIDNIIWPEEPDFIEEKNV